MRLIKALPASVPKNSSLSSVSKYPRAVSKRIESRGIPESGLFMIHDARRAKEAAEMALSDDLRKRDERKIERASQPTLVLSRTSTPSTTSARPPVERLRRRPAVRDVTFALHRGEVLGLAGLVEAGRSETTRIIFGADRAETGKMLLDGVEFLPRSLSRLGFRLHGIDAEKRMSSDMVLSALSTMSDTGSVCAGLGGPFTGR